MLYRIITEDKNANDVAKIVSRYFDGFTMIPSCEGYWKGKLEISLIIEVDSIATDETHAKIMAIAKEIKILNAQETVMIQKIHSATSFV